MSDESLFREVDEEVRREQIEKLWRRYGNLFVAFSLGLIVAVAAFKGWQYYEKKQAEAAGVAYIEALYLADQGKNKEADEKLAALAAGSHAGVATLARMQQAGSKARAGMKESAVKIYDAIAADDSVDRALRDAAKVRAAWLLADSLKRSELEKRLGGLDVAGNPWRASAREIIALAAWREGDLKTMQKRLGEIITDPDSQAGARQRAEIMLSFIAPKLARKAADGDSKKATND